MAEGGYAQHVPKQTVHSERSKPGDLSIQAFGAVIWGLFFSVAPIFEGLILGAIIWIPLLIWREKVRARMYGFSAGFFVRLAIIAAMVAGAICLPTKHEDRLIITGLPGNRVTLGELKQHTRLTCERDQESVGITLSSNEPNLREIIGAIESQTRLRCDVTRCGNSASFLAGASIIAVKIHEVP
jgi:hypothetical protein